VASSLTTGTIGKTGLFITKFVEVFVEVSDGISTCPVVIVFAGIILSII
jgi:hypothetical protein